MSMFTKFDVAKATKFWRTFFLMWIFCNEELRLSCDVCNFRILTNKQTRVKQIWLVLVAFESVFTEFYK